VRDRRGDSGKPHECHFWRTLIVPELDLEAAAQPSHCSALESSGRSCGGFARPISSERRLVFVVASALSGLDLIARYASARAAP
jgi:hypothetical protein